MANRYFDPKNDAAFKKLFGTEDKKPLLIEFLNAILELKGDREIIDLTYLPQADVPLLPDQKTGIVDVRCRDLAGRMFIIEMQNKSVPGFTKRVQLYGSHAYVSQLLKGETYLELHPVIILAIRNYIAFPAKDQDKPISYHKMLDVDTLENDLKNLGYAFLELPKFKKSAEECHTLQEKWMHFFKHVPEEDHPAFEDPNILKAYDTMEQFNWTQAEQLQYIHANNIAVGDAETEKLKFEEGKIEGEIIGLEKGARSKEITMIRTMHANGASIDTISQLTGLSVEEIQNILA